MNNDKHPTDDRPNGAPPEPEAGDTVLYRPPDPSSRSSTAAGSFPPDAMFFFGNRVGSFRVLRFLGRGGMGEVYEAEQVDTGRRVALKAMRANPRRSPLKRSVSRGKDSWLRRSTIRTASTSSARKKRRERSSSRWSWCGEAPWKSAWRNADRWPTRKRSTRSFNSPPASAPPARRVFSTGTSSRPTVSSTGTERSRSATSASPFR